MSATAENAAKALQDLLLRNFINREMFSIAMADDCLHAYIRCPKKRWPVAIPEFSEGIPIEWHWNIGPTIALAQI